MKMRDVLHCRSVWLVTFNHCTHCVFEHVKRVFALTHICVCPCTENMSRFKGCGGSVCVSRGCGRGWLMLFCLPWFVCLCNGGEGMGGICRARNSLCWGGLVLE